MELSQVWRVTVSVATMEDISQVNSLTRSRSAYDLVAVRPTTERAWTAAAGECECDIISLDLCSARLPFTVRRKQLCQAAGRGIAFEVAIADALRDVTARRNLFQNVQQLVRFLPQSKIIFTSSATSPLEMRGPYEFGNLAVVMGIQPHKGGAKAVVSDNALAVLLKGASRRSAGGMASHGGVRVQNMPPRGHGLNRGEDGKGGDGRSTPQFLQGQGSDSVDTQNRRLGDTDETDDRDEIMEA
eukprot:GHVU01115065.1.p1 GENE.GHVU01115065.1~~GHVU01115065.1.p1  ORF type:complete len:243 (-),score=14.52 GHVU01115065.1:4-732(-)